MALSIPSVTNPFDPANPIAPAYGWLAGVFLDIRGGKGRVVLDIHPNEAAWQSQPIAQLSVSLGDQLVGADPQATPPVAAVTFPTLAELMADADFAAAYAVIGGKLYEALLKHPRLNGSSIV